MERVKASCVCVCVLQVNVELLPEGGEGDLCEGEERLSALLERGITPTLAMPETVTVTLTQNPDAGWCFVLSFLKAYRSANHTGLPLRASLMQVGDGKGCGSVPRSCDQ